MGATAQKGVRRVITQPEEYEYTVDLVDFFDFFGIPHDNGESPTNFHWTGDGKMILRTKKL